MNLFKLANEYETIANETPLIKSINEYLKLAQDYSGNYTTANDHWVFKSQDSKTKALFGDTDKGKHVSVEKFIDQLTGYSGVKFIGTADNGNLIYDWTHSKYCHVRFYVLSESQLSEKQKNELIDGDLSSYEQIFTKVAVKPLHDYNEDLKIGKWYVFSFNEFAKLDIKFGRLSSMFEKLYNSKNIEFKKEEPKAQEIQQSNNNLYDKLYKELESIWAGLNKSIESFIIQYGKYKPAHSIKHVYDSKNIIVDFIESILNLIDAHVPIDEIVRTYKEIKNIEKIIVVEPQSTDDFKNMSFLIFKGCLDVLRETIQMAGFGEEYMDNEYLTTKE